MPLPSSSSSNKLAHRVTQFVAILILIGGLVIATGVAPVSWILFERVDGQVRARVQSCVFFVVPYQTDRVDVVTEIDSGIRSGSEQRRQGRVIPNKTADDVGLLKIRGPSQNVEVPVAPSSLDSVKAQARAFLADPQAAELKLFVVANWLFSIVFSGLATVFYGIIAVSLVYAAGQSVCKKLGLVKRRR